jgi:hypothetical protein
MAAPVYYTADMVRALPDAGNRYETVHGELLVTPAPRAWHQEIVIRILQELRAYSVRRTTIYPWSRAIESAGTSGAAQPFALELEDLFRHPEP